MRQPKKTKRPPRKPKQKRYTRGRMARPKKQSEDLRVYISARVLPHLVKKVEARTKTGNPSKSQFVEKALEFYFEHLEKTEPPPKP